MSYCLCAAIERAIKRILIDTGWSFAQSLSSSLRRVQIAFDTLHDELKSAFFTVVNFLAGCQASVLRRDVPVIMNR